MGIAYNTSIVTDGLVYTLDFANSRCYSGTGNTVYQLSSTGSSAALENGPTYSTSNGGSLVFDGANDRIALPVASLLYGTGAKTLTAWAKLTANTGSWQMIFGYGTANTNAAFFIGVYGLSSLFGGFNTDLQSTSVSLNTWFNITGTYDGSTANLYVNGVLGLSVSRGWNTVQSGQAYIGAQIGPQQYWNGSISECRLYNRALSAKEIAQNFNATRDRYGI
jgi:hypothetical protein